MSSDDEVYTKFAVSYESGTDDCGSSAGMDDDGDYDDDDNLAVNSNNGLASPKPRMRKERTWSLSKAATTTISKNENILRTRQRTIYIAGRPPWYDAHGQLLEPLIIGNYSIILISFACNRQENSNDLDLLSAKRCLRWKCFRQNDRGKEDYRSIGRTLGHLA